MRKITSLVTNITIAGLRTKLVYPDDTNVTYEYDTLSRLTKVKYEGSTIAEYSYDELSRRTLLTYGNDANIVYQYDIGDRLTRITNNMDACSIDVQYSDYDNVGNRRNMLINGDESQYSYDKLYQLANVDYPAGFGTDANYYYDCLGSRTSVVAGSTTNYLHNSLNQYTSVGGTNYSYDSKGNLTNDGTYKYYYDCENRLIDVNNASTNAHIAHYTYDYTGRRMAKTVYGSPDVTTKYCYDGDDLIAEYSSGGTLLKKYIYGPGIDEPVCMIDVANSNAKYYYHFDGLGSVVALSNSSGSVVEQYSYDVFGTPTATSSIGNSYMFTGREYDSETGNYYYRARYYKPSIGRFLQTDPIGVAGGINIYTYCENNPIMLIDPMGLDWFEGTVNFCAGAGDSLSFGVTAGIRSLIGLDNVDATSTAYTAGEYTEVGVEITLTLGSAALKTAAKKTGQKVARAAARELTEDIVRNGEKLHHINPLFGHPGGAKALFPTGGLPAVIHSGPWNLALLDAGAHTAAHCSLRTIEQALTIAFNPAMTAMRIARNINSNSNNISGNQTFGSSRKK